MFFFLGGEMTMVDGEGSIAFSAHWEGEVWLLLFLLSLLLILAFLLSLLSFSSNLSLCCCHWVCCNHDGWGGRVGCIECTLAKRKRSNTEVIIHLVSPLSQWSQLQYKVETQLKLQLLALFWLFKSWSSCFCREQICLGRGSGEGLRGDRSQFVRVGPLSIRSICHPLNH